MFVCSPDRLSVCVCVYACACFVSLIVCLRVVCAFASLFVYSFVLVVRCLFARTSVRLCVLVCLHHVVLLCWFACLAVCVNVCLLARLVEHLLVSLYVCVLTCLFVQMLCLCMRVFVCPFVSGVSSFVC